MQDLSQDNDCSNGERILMANITIEAATGRVARLLCRILWPQCRISHDGHVFPAKSQPAHKQIARRQSNPAGPGMLAPGRTYQAKPANNRVLCV